MEVSEPDASVCQAVHVRCFDLAAISSDVREAHIIRENDQKIGTSFLCHFSGCLGCLLTLLLRVEFLVWNLAQRTKGKGTRDINAIRSSVVKYRKIFYHIALV